MNGFKHAVLGAAMLAISGSASAFDLSDLDTFNVLLNNSNQSQAVSFSIAGWDAGWTAADILAINFNFTFTDDAFPAGDLTDSGALGTLENATITFGGVALYTGEEIDTGLLSTSYTVGNDFDTLVAALVAGSGALSGSVNRTIGDFTFNTAEIVVSVVPEPEAYAMLLAGLGLVGLMTAYRRKAA